MFKHRENIQFLNGRTSDIVPYNSFSSSNQYPTMYIFGHFVQSLELHWITTTSLHLRVPNHEDLKQQQQERHRLRRSQHHNPFYCNRKTQSSSAPLEKQIKSIFFLHLSTPGLYLTLVTDATSLLWLQNRNIRLRAINQMKQTSLNAFLNISLGSREFCKCRASQCLGTTLMLSRLGLLGQNQWGWNKSERIGRSQNMHSVRPTSFLQVPVDPTLQRANTHPRFPQHSRCRWCLPSYDISL